MTFILEWTDADRNILTEVARVSTRLAALNEAVRFTESAPGVFWNRVVTDSSSGILYKFEAADYMMQLVGELTVRKTQ